MIFLRVKVEFYDTFNIIHEVIITSNPYKYPNTTKFLIVGIRIHKDQQIRDLKANRIRKIYISLHNNDVVNKNIFVGG